MTEDLDIKKFIGGLSWVGDPTGMFDTIWLVHRGVSVASVESGAKDAKGRVSSYNVHTLHSASDLNGMEKRTFWGAFLDLPSAKAKAEAKCAWTTKSE